MELIDRDMYNECVAAQAQLQHVAGIIDGFESLDINVATDEDFDEYILPATELLEKLAVIIGDRAKLYIEGV